MQERFQGEFNYLMSVFDRSSGISVDHFSNGQIRYRHRMYYGSMGTWVSQSRALDLLRETENINIERSNRVLEEAFGDEGVISHNDLMRLIIPIFIDQGMDF